MARCKFCGLNRAEVYLDYARLSLCPSCFTSFYENKVRKIVSKYKMVRDGDRLAIAVSGGKDSSVLLYVFRKLFPNLSITGIHINLGISEYSDYCEEIIRDFAKRLNVELIIVNIKEEYGFKIEDFKNTFYRRKLCAPCGVVKRYILNKIAFERGFTKLATGHNLDDLVAFLLNHYIHGDVDQIVRIKPVLPGSKIGFVTKIKPLCEITEMENIFYAEYNQIPYRVEECPLSSGPTVETRREILELLIRKNPSFRHIFFKSHLKRILPALKVESSVMLDKCRNCGMPSSSKTCSFCKLVSKIALKSVSN